MAMMCGLQFGVQARPDALQEYIPGQLLQAFAASVGTHLLPQLTQSAAAQNTTVHVAPKQASNAPSGHEERPGPSVSAASSKRWPDASLGLMPPGAAASPEPAADVAASAAALLHGQHEQDMAPRAEHDQPDHVMEYANEGAASSYEGNWPSSYCSSSVDGASSWVTCLDPHCDASHTSWDGSASFSPGRTPLHVPSAPFGVPRLPEAWRLPHQPAHRTATHLGQGTLGMIKPLPGR